MSRSRIETAASDWVARRDAGISAAEEAAFQAWLAEPAHARAFADHEETFRFFGRPGRTREGTSLAREIRQRARRKRRRRLAIGAGAAASILAAVVLWRPWSEPRQLIPIRNAIVVRPLSRTLPDGSIVEFKAGTRIAAGFAATGTGPRLVKLIEGEAHFQVAKNRERPFIVAVDNLEVRAVGTAFTVERTESKVEVVVAEGVVAVEQKVEAASPVAAPVSSTVATLSAGERTVVELSPGEAAVPSIEPLAADALALRLSWRTPRLEFSSTPLTEAVRLVNEFNDVKFEVADPALDSLEVSGYFRANQPDTFLLLLEEGLGVAGDRQGNRIMLRKAR